MRIFFDVSAIPEVGRAVTGISRVILSILLEIVRLRSDEIEVYGISFRPEDLANGQQGRLWSLREISHAGSAVLKPDDIPDDLKDRLPASLRAGDVVLCLGEQWLFSGTLPTLAALKQKHEVRVVSMVHDLVPFFMPELYWPRFPETYTKCVRGLIEISNSVIVNSENTKRDLRVFIDSSGDKSVTRISLGSELSDPGAFTERSLDVPHGRYVLCVGTIQPRKNHALLLAVWRLLLARVPQQCPRLVLVGMKGWNSDDLLYFFSNNPQLSDLITIIEKPTDRELGALYRNAWLTVYPSLYEGWGLPIAESLSAGKLCLSSNASAMPEVGGDLCEYFSPYDPVALCGLIIKYLNDPQALATAERAIRCTYRPHTWRETAHDLLKALAASDHVTARVQ